MKAITRERLLTATEAEAVELIRAEIRNELLILPTQTCFDDALDYLESIAIRRGACDELMEHRLVHGVCTLPNGGGYAHAWVERGDEAIGCGLIRGIRAYYFCSRRDYYREFRPQMMTKYTVIEAWAENKRTNHYGPWESYYRDMITGDNNE